MLKLAMILRRGKCDGKDDPRVVWLSLPQVAFFAKEAGKSPRSCLVRKGKGRLCSESCAVSGCYRG